MAFVQALVKLTTISQLAIVGLVASPLIVTAGAVIYLTSSKNNREKEIMIDETEIKNWSSLRQIYNATYIEYYDKQKGNLVARYKFRRIANAFIYISVKEATQKEKKHVEIAFVLPYDIVKAHTHFVAGVQKIYGDFYIDMIHMQQINGNCIYSWDPIIPSDDYEKIRGRVSFSKFLNFISEDQYSIKQEKPNIEDYKACAIYMKNKRIGWASQDTMTLFKNWYGIPDLSFISSISLSTPRKGKDERKYPSIEFKLDMKKCKEYGMTQRADLSKLCIYDPRGYCK